MSDLLRPRIVNVVSPETCPACDSTTRVLVAIRHPVMRRFATELLARECGCWASDDVAVGEMLPSAIDRFRPDLLVVDAGDFPACCQDAIDAFPRSRVVVIGPEPDPGYGAAALAQGAAACITRDTVGDELVPAIRAALGDRDDDSLPWTRLDRHAGRAWDEDHLSRSRPRLAHSHADVQPLYSARSCYYTVSDHTRTS